MENTNVMNETVAPQTPAPVPAAPYAPAEAPAKKPDALTYTVGGFAIFGAVNAVYWAVKGGMFVAKKVKEARANKAAAQPTPAPQQETPAEEAKTE